MSLVGPDSQISEETLREMFLGHLEGIHSMAETLARPPHPVTDPARIELARSFAEHVVRLLEADGRKGVEALRDRVNLSYEAMLLLIDQLKLYTEAPKVPQGRSASS